MKLAALLSLVVVTLTGSTASAQITTKMRLKAVYRETTKSKKTFRNVFVTGKASYPDGVFLKVGIRHHTQKAVYLDWVDAPVKNGEFVAEFGPWEQSIPPGRYMVESWFEYDRQSNSAKAVLDEMEEFEKCLTDDPDYQEKYKKENPERYEKLMKMIKLTGKCGSNKAYGICDLMIGSPESAEAASQEEREFLRGHADSIRELTKEAMNIWAQHNDPNRSTNLNADAYAEWAQIWRDTVLALDGELATRLRNVKMNEYSAASQMLVAAIVDLQAIETIAASSLYGPNAEKVLKLAEFQSRESSLTKDERRQRDALKSDLAGMHSDLEMAQNDLVEHLAEALYGNKGLNPAPAKKDVTIEELKVEFGFAPPPEDNK
jgi:hypothetical protein